MNQASRDLKKFLNNALILFWFLGGGSVYFVLNRNGGLLAFAGVIVILFLLFKPNTSKRTLVALFLSLSLVLFLLVVNYIFSVKPQDYTKYGYLYFEFIVGGAFCIYIYSTYKYADFVKSVFKILKFIRFHALISAILISFLPFLFTLTVSNEFSGYKAQTFLYLFFKVSDQYSFKFLGLTITRNQGLFWEPGVLQIYLNLLLLFQLYVFNSKKTDIALTVICVITTYSTSAFAIMIIVMFSFIVRLIRKKPSTLIPILLTMLLIFVPLFKSNVENKFQGEHQTSSLVRVYDFVQQIEVVKQYFITGVGLDDQRYEIIRLKHGLTPFFREIMGTNQVERGSTNSVLFLLATMGIFMGSILLFAFANQNLILEQKSILTILLIMGVMVEPLLLKPFFVSLILSGLMGLWHRKNNVKNNFWRKEITNEILNDKGNKQDYHLKTQRVH